MQRSIRGALTGIAVATLLAMPAVAQQPAPNMPMDQGTRAPATGDSAEMRALNAANQTMMAGMNAPMTGNADQDFVAMMIPHHQGAVDMARVELKYGKDARLRRLAHAIIRSQDKQIAEMKAWQVRHPSKH